MTGLLLVTAAIIPQWMTDRLDIALAVGGAGLLLVIVWFAGTRAWLRRRSADQPSVFAEEPPEGWGPVRIRYLYSGRVDRASHAAAVFSMAVKGFLVIERQGHGYTLRRCGTSFTMLSPDEKAIADGLFLNKQERPAGVRPLSMTNESRKEILERADKAHKNTLFVPHDRVATIGVGIAYLVTVATMLAGPAPGPAPLPGKGMHIFAALFIAFWSYGWLWGWASMIGSGLWGCVRELLDVRSVREFAWRLLLALGLFIVTSPWTFGAVLALGFLAAGSPVNIVTFFVCFHYAAVDRGGFRACTRTGAELMARVEGYRQFLIGSERPFQNRPRNLRLGPKDFERHLPYAIALDAAGDWLHRFSEPLSRDAHLPSDYWPQWLKTDETMPEDLDRELRRLCRHLGCRLRTSRSRTPF